MLKEIKSVRQIPGEAFRRWFQDKYFDLIVHYNPKKEITAFELCYNLLIPFAEIHVYPVSSFYKMILDTCPVKAWIAIKSAPGISA